MCKICPHCKKMIHGNHAVYANHVRWCDDNHNTKRHFHRETKKKIFTQKCVVCGESYNVLVTDKQFEKGNFRKTCCDICSKKLTAMKTDKSIKNKKISRANKKISRTNKKIRLIPCKYCGKIFSPRKIKNIFCSPKCSALYRSNTDDYKKYRYQCSFKFGLNEYPGYFDLSNIKTLGIYKPTNRGDNPNGISRDHMISIKYGYEHNIDPYLISHPANCQLMTQTENIRKNKNCSITLQELYNRVERFEMLYGKYPNKI